MEFLRFGSSIPGSYWGCCCVDIIQNFTVDPDAKASIQCVSGDSGTALGDKFFGPTYRDIFWQRLRIGTFSDRDMPNHAFLAVLTESQVSSGVGKRWMEILHEAGFEFLRVIDNSVYTGKELLKDPTKPTGTPHKNYLFGLFRNIGSGAVPDPFQPPAGWVALGENTKTQREIYDSINVKFLKRAELEQMGVPVTLAGLRSQNPQELASVREARNEKQGKAPQKPIFAAPEAMNAIA